MRTAVLAYSGGLDTSCAIAWLTEDYGFDEVVAVLVDVGQDTDFEPAIARGHAAGADDVLLLDRKDEFTEEQVAKALVANALYEGKYPLISALSRPVIAEAVAGVAVELDAEAVVHGCTGKGNDQVRFELAFKASYPGVRVIAPLRDRVWTRDEEIAYARARGIPVEAKPESPYSIDDNLFGRAIEAGVLEDPWAAPPEEAFALTASPAGSHAPADVVVGFESGLPVSVDGEELALADLVLALNEQAGGYGIGRVDMIENRVVGIKSRELYEAPAALTLIAAHQALEDLVLTKAELVAKRELEPKWASLVYDGLWFSPARAAYDAFFAETQKLVDGEVRVTLQPGCSVVSGRRSEHALYAESLASYGSGETFPHDAAEGFIRLAGLETELAAVRAGKSVAHA
jgi:argininosuccinate synthase